MKIPARGFWVRGFRNLLSRLPPTETRVPNPGENCVSTITLQHCQVVTVLQRETPTDLAIALSFSGTGTVNVIAEPNGVSPSGSASGGVPFAGTANDCVILRLHYVKAEGGPESVSVTFNYFEI